MYLRSGEGISIIFSVGIIVRDPEADSGGKGKSERVEKNCAPFFPACLDFPLPPLSAPGSPRMIRHQQCSKQNLEFQLVIWASSSLNLLAWGYFLFVLVNDFVDFVAQQKKIYLSQTTIRDFFEP